MGLFIMMSDLFFLGNTVWMIADVAQNSMLVETNVVTKIVPNREPGLG